MSTNFNSLAAWTDWEQLASGTLAIDSHMHVSKASKFGDDIWDFVDLNNPRTLTLAPGMLKINWQLYTTILPVPLLYSIKVIGFFYIRCPAIISTSRRPNKHGFAPSTWCNCLNSLLSFFAEICVQSQLPVTADGIKRICIETVQDITLDDMRNALPSWSRSSQLTSIRPALIAFANPIVQKYLPGFNGQQPFVQWNAHDLKSLKCIPEESDGYIKSGFRDKPISDELFAFMTRVASQDIFSFLNALGMPIASLPELIDANYKNEVVNTVDFKKSYFNYKSLTDYKHVNNIERIKAGKSRSKFGNHVIKFNSESPISTTGMQAVISRIQNAAKYIVLQFVGMRFGEGALLKRGCISRLASGDYVIKSTLLKNQSVNSITGLDYWVACPIVRDAVAVLEELSDFCGSDYLLISSMRYSGQYSEVPGKIAALNTMLTTYLYDIDTERVYSKDNSKSSSTRFRFLWVEPSYKITVHRLRHTLALHMSRAGLGIPYISFHLKHVYQAHRRLQSLQDVTLGYGDLGSDIFQNAVGIAQANREIVSAIYHPDAAVVGPGAELFKQRRTYFFTGMYRAGWQFEEVMDYLASRGSLMADVGLGYCQGRNEVESEDGKREPPPCLGQLKCNPARCKNAVIPKSKSLIWQQIYKENHRRLNDPLMAHAKSEHLAMMKEAEQVLIQLGVQIE